VILDWVANHTAWDNPWIVNTTWYTRNQSGAITHPPGTNWLDVADLDYSNNAMRRAMINAMKYWILAANIDGYRCDYADGVPYDFWKQAIDTLNAIPGRDLVLLAEGARKDHFTAGFQMNYGWDYFGGLVSVFKDGQASSGLSAIDADETFNMPAGTYRLRFTANHDEVAWNDTPLGLFGGLDGSMAAFVLAAYMGGVPLIYNGQEVGCPVKLPFFSRSPIDWTTNPDMTRAYKKLLAFRQGSAAVEEGTLEDYSNQDIAAFKRKAGAEEVVVLVNTRNTTVNYTLPAALVNTNWVDALSNAPVTLATNLSLAPYSYLLLKN
jgi:glycosidase